MIVDPRDVAEVAVTALVQESRKGEVLTLTGPEAISVPEQARRLGEVLGRPVPVEDVAVEGLGLPRDVSLGTAWALAGHNAVVTPDVTLVLRRAPRSYEEWAHAHRQAF